MSGSNSKSKAEVNHNPSEYRAWKNSKKLSTKISQGLTLLNETIVANLLRDTTESIVVIRATTKQCTSTANCVAWIPLELIFQICLLLSPKQVRKLHTTPHCEEKSSFDTKINGNTALLCPHLSTKSQMVAHAEWHFVKAQCVLLTKRASHQQRVGLCTRPQCLGMSQLNSFLPSRK